MREQADSSAHANPVDLSDIPAFPPVALRLLDLLSRDDVRLRELNELLLSDAALAAQILRLANSPLFGHTARIRTLDRALAALGLNRVQGLAVTVATGNYARAALRFEELRRCWRHTLACAVLSQELARACGMPEDRAYGVGLLHDIGRLGLLVSHPAEYALMLREADRDIAGLLNQEARRFGMDHCEAGRQLAARWGLPPDFAVAAGRHHDSPSGGAPDPLMVVHLACQLADVVGFSVVTPLRAATFDEVLACLPSSARQRIETDPEVLRATVQRRIDSYDSLGVHPTAASPFAPEPADERTEPQPAPSLFRPLLWEAAVVAIAGVVFAAVLLGAYFIWGR